MSKTKKEKSKKYYRLMIKDHQQILAKMRFVINHLLDNVVADISASADTVNHQIRYAEYAQKQPEIDPKIAPNIVGDEGQPIDISVFQHEEKNSWKNPVNEDQKLNHIPLKLWTEKESVADIIAKVGRITLKIIPLERELAKLDLTKIDLEELHNIAEKLDENMEMVQCDIEIIEQYIERYIRDNPESVRMILNRDYKFNNL